MRERGLAGLLALGAALAATIALELTRGTADDGGMIAPVPRSAPALPSRAAAPPSEEDRQGLVDGILARPLFATSRRPADAPAAGPASAPASLPRLAGVLVHGGSRSAIFAATGNGRPAVVGEGGRVGGYTVQSIEAGQVTIAGPSGAQVLRPAFDARAPGAAPPPGAGLPGVPAALPGAAKPPAAFSPVDVLQSLRGLPGLSGGATAR